MEFLHRQGGRMPRLSRNPGNKDGMSPGMLWYQDNHRQLLLVDIWHSQLEPLFSLQINTNKTN